MPDVTPFDEFEPRFERAYRRYLDEAPTEVDAMAVARRVTATRTGIAWPWPQTTTLFGRSPQLAWLLLAALLTLALVASALIVGSWQRRAVSVVPSPSSSAVTTPAPTAPAVTPSTAAPDDGPTVALVPTGVDILNTGPGRYSDMVADGAGMLWALESGRLTRVNPADESTTDWTVADDAAFVATGIFPASDTGVWIITGKTLRHFDGSVFRTVITAPEDIALGAEGRGGDLWAATLTGTIFHRQSGSWDRLEPGTSPDANVTSLAVDQDGNAWIGWMQYPWPPGSGWVMRYDGSGWTRFDGNDAAPLGRAISSVVAADDGTVWATSDGGLAKFDGRAWTEVAQPVAGGRSPVSVTQADDGSLWLADGPINANVNMIIVRHYDGQTWQAYGTEQGLPLDAYFRVASIETTPYGVFVGTGAGIFRLNGGSFERVGEAGTPTDPAVALAISHDDLWATAVDGLWHYTDGRWVLQPVDQQHPLWSPQQMLKGRDAAVWAVGEFGVARLGINSTAWEIVDPTPANALAFDSHGVAWLASAGASGSGVGLWTLTGDGSGWTRRDLPSMPIDDFPGRISIGVDGNDDVWLGVQIAYFPGALGRFDGQSWHMYDQLGGSPVEGARVLDSVIGALWIAIQPNEAEVSTYLVNRVDSADSTQILTVPGALTATEPFVGGDGQVWIQTEQGPARYDYGWTDGWSHPYADFPLATSYWSFAVAADGTFFGESATGIVRFPPVN